MKRTMAILTAAIVTIAGAAPLYAASTAPAKENSRFGLFNAVYNSAIIQRSQTTTFLEKRLFKIDRKTGETWMLIDAIREGKDIKFWKKIENETKGK
jgi:hypothetical protein